MEKTQNECMTIDLLIVFDTAVIFQGSSNPSKDRTAPSVVKSDSQYVFCSEIDDEQSKNPLIISACAGDIMKIRGTSIYQNSEQAVIIYKVTSQGWLGSKETFEANPVTVDQAVQPDPSSTDGLPALHVKANFTSMNTVIQSSGRKKYRVCFALYDLDNTGEIQNLVGYYYWDMKIKLVDPYSLSR